MNATGRHRLRLVDITARPRPVATLAVFVLVLGGGAWLLLNEQHAWTIYGGFVGALLAGKLALSLAPPPQWQPADPAIRVCVVVPLYNEDPATLARCLASIAAQTHQPTHVRIVDDGSDDGRAYVVAADWARRVHLSGSATVIAQANAGKRAAMGRAFAELGERVEVFVCVDSDTVLEPNAIRAGLAPFSDPRTAAVTGTVVALNHDSGLLPRLLDLRYVNAFLYERAAYSRLGAVLCVCGSLAFWRADIIVRHLGDFLGQTFLGQPATYGDDRHLTNLSLQHGRVVLAHDAIARTAVPERGGHLIRQQIRWGRSFFRESLWSLTNLSPRRVAWWLAAVETVSWAGFTTGLVATLFVLPAVTGEVHVWDYLTWVTLGGWARSVHVFSIRRPDYPRAQQLGVFLLAPLYGVLHVLVLLPLRVWSLCTLRATGWGTRASGAEILVAEAVAA